MEVNIDVAKKLYFLNPVIEKMKGDLQDLVEARDKLLASGPQHKPAADMFDFLIRTYQETLDKMKKEHERIIDEEIEARMKEEEEDPSPVEYKIFIVGSK